MKAIVAVDEKWGIGKDGQLLARLPGDLKYFKEKTIGQTIIMGRKTLESLPGGKALPNRTTCVLSRDMTYKRDDCVMFYSPNDLAFGLEYTDSEEVYVCGGAQIYEMFYDACSSFLVTKIFAEFKADKYFPNLDEKNDLEITWESDIQEENGIKYQWVEYGRCK